MPTMARAPLTLLAVGSAEADGLQALQRLRAQGALIAHTPDPARADAWLATLLPDLVLALPAATAGLRLPADRTLSWDGRADSLARLLQPWLRAPGSGPERFDRLELDEAAGRVRWQDAEGRLLEQAIPATELRLLRCLARRQGLAVSRAELLQEVWPADAQPQARSVDQVVRRLRQLLQPLGLAQGLRSLRGIGYRLDLAPVATAD